MLTQQGAGSIYTSGNDYIKWVRAVMNREPPITEEVSKGITKPRTIESPEDDINDLPPLTSTTLYAAGWDVRYYRGHKIVSHDGMTSGFGSVHFFIPVFEFGAVLFGNSTGEGEMGAGAVTAVLSHELIDEVLNVPDSERPDWNARARNEEKERQDNDTEDKDLEKMLAVDMTQRQPQETPLSAYTGNYHHAGYHSLVVEIRDDKLFVDAEDRSEGFNLTFEHVCDQTKYIAHLKHYLEGGDEKVAAEFVFEKDRVVRMGLRLELQLDEYIWFDREESVVTTDQTVKC